ncbi:uncharacterized protein AMSG_04609 [Thecamonas trahens ATCC 50062]|uniref:Uncharacterized protein n=1 Tax=Thecamonas trahens ATCC 50062 TaxID=461836 RepID=A0A0L0D942_THETB|nr:hypothetical protein AMSG_04609 [Thecamonas trahens ATCC 50062]KNC48864.1 hypothetical protein AMSG_04609 [Thecamonas trahens ATCC 50062]|eukprot:XP_013758284.1 hypothetical protein AMSG_04609 [Thecamonas trahens ATCC 50062]
MPRKEKLVFWHGVLHLGAEEHPFFDISMRFDENTEEWLVESTDVPPLVVDDSHVLEVRWLVEADAVACESRFLVASEKLRIQPAELPSVLPARQRHRRGSTAGGMMAGPSIASAIARGGESSSDVSGSGSRSRSVSGSGDGEWDPGASVWDEELFASLAEEQSTRDAVASVDALKLERRVLERAAREDRDVPSRHSQPSRVFASVAGTGSFRLMRHWLYDVWLLKGVSVRIPAARLLALPDVLQPVRWRLPTTTKAPILKKVQRSIRYGKKRIKR